MFDAENEELKRLADAISRIHLTFKGRESYMPLVREYNRILDGMLDRGLRESLDPEVELADDLISPRYLEMLRRPNG